MPFIKNKTRASVAMVTAVLLMGAMGGCGKSEKSSEALLAEAKQFMQTGDNKAAIIQLKNALVQKPSDAESRLILGQLYNETGDGASAEKEVRKALELGAAKDKALPSLATTRLILGQLYNETGDGASAEKEVRKALELGAAKDKALPSLATALLIQQQFQKAIDEIAGATPSAELLTLRGDAYTGLGQGEKAAQAYAEALALKPGHGPALIGSARLLMAKKDLDGAAALAEQAVKANPNDALVWMFKGDLLRAQGKSDEALAAYDQVLKIKPAHRSAHLEKAFVNIASGKFEAAKADIEAARKNTPSGLMVLYAQALLDFTQGKHAAAKDSLLKILRVAPEHMPSVLMAGSVEYALGSMEQAERHLRKYLTAMPDHRYARKMLVSTLMKMGQTSEALAQLNPMLEGDTKDVQLLALAGEVNMQAREFSKATAYFEEASKLAPNAANLRTSLALGKLALGDDERAIAELEQSTKLDTASPRAGTLLVMTELRMKRYDKALVAVKALEATQPTDPTVQNLKGGVYLGMNDLANARASFEKAMVLKPTFFPALANLAQMAARENKPDVARQLLQGFLEKDKKSIEAMNGLAQLAAAQNKPDEVTQWLEKASAENPESVAAARALGGHYLQIGQKAKVLTLARKFQVANPKDLDLLDLLGQAQLANDDLNGALESYSKLSAAAPKSAMAHFRLAVVHIRMKNLAASGEHLKKALALQPDYIDAQVAQAELAVRAGQPDQAMALARQIQKQHPKAAVGYLLEAGLLQNQSKFPQAAAAYEQAFNYAKTSSNLIKWHAAMRQAGKQKEADARLDKWQAEHPNDAALMMYVAENYLARKQYKPAIASLEAVIKSMPSNAPALNNLAWAYLQEKDARAVATAEKALALAGDSAAVTDTLGWVLLETGNVPKGLTLLQKAVSMAPGSADIRFHLAVALARSGDKAGAKRELEQVLSNKNFVQTDEVKALAKQL